MPGARPESRGPVCAVTACRTSTSVVAGRVRGLVAVRCSRCGRVSHNVDRTGAARPHLQRTSERYGPRIAVRGPIDCASDRQTSGDPSRRSARDRPPRPPGRAHCRARGGARRARSRPAARRDHRGRRELARASSTVGPGSARSPATRSRDTRASASATTAASTSSAKPGGAAAATCGGSTRPTVASSGRSTDCARRRPRSARPTRSCAARSSSCSSIPPVPGGARASGPALTPKRSKKGRS